MEKETFDYCPICLAKVEGVMAYFHCVKTEVKNIDQQLEEVLNDTEL